MNITPKKCCEDLPEEQFFGLFRSNSFEGSLRHYGDPKRPPLQDKHHRREYCHLNCRKPYDKAEQIVHYAMVRQQEMLRSRERARDASRSRNRHLAKCQGKEIRMGIVKGGSIIKSNVERDCVGMVVARYYQSSEEKRQDDSNGKPEIRQAVAVVPLISPFAAEEEPEAEPAIPLETHDDEMWDIPEQPFAGTSPVVLQSKQTEGGTPQQHQLQCGTSEPHQQPIQSSATGNPQVTFEETHLSIQLEALRYKISLRILHNLFARTASLSSVVASIVRKRPVLASLQARLEEELLANSHSWMHRLAGN